MRRTVLIVPGLLSVPEGDTYLRQGLQNLTLLSEMGALSKVATIPSCETPEAMLLGLSPSIVDLHQGPLTVSALGFDPPEKSTHFHLSLMSFQDGIATATGVLPNAEEIKVLLTAAKRLNTKLLTVLTGEGADHALVWESRGDLGTTSSTDLSGKTTRDHLPQGDGESHLRRFIDDSINLLGELELNVRRVDEGFPPFNLLWPWGQGERTNVPNLSLRRGEPATVESASMRLVGLTRLAGYKHLDRGLVGKGVDTKLRLIADRAVKRDLSIVYLDAPLELRQEEKAEELAWFIRQLDKDLLGPLLEDHRKTLSRLTLIAPAPISLNETGGIASSPIGLSITAETGHISHNSYPFDERALEERSVPTRDLWTLVESAIA